MRYQVILEESKVGTLAGIYLDHSCPDSIEDASYSLESMGAVDVDHTIVAGKTMVIGIIK